MPLRKVLNCLAVLLAAAFLLCSLCSCRESPVLQETIYMSAQEQDEEQEALEPEDEGEEDEQFDNEKDDTAETERDEETELGVEEQEEEPAEEQEQEVSHSAEMEYSATANHDWEASGSVTEAAQNGSGNAEQIETVPDEEQTDISEELTAENTADPEAETEKLIVDGAGRSVSIPEKVETVAAVGWSAQMVEMLGGSGRLAAADGNFLSSELARAAFSDISEISALWSGSGTENMGEGSFERLIELHPDLCFEVSGAHTFTNSQIAELEEAGIAYVVLPKLNSLDNLDTSLSIMAQVLTSNYSSGESAENIAGRYSAWARGLTAEVKSRSSGTVFSSLYIAGWDMEADYVLNNTQGAEFPTGLGLAYAYSPLKTQFLTTFMSAAGITNESTRIASLYRNTDYLYVTPMFQQFMPTVTGSRATYYDSAGKTAASKELFVSRLVGGDTYYELGNESYPAIIAADDYVKSQIENNFYWQYHELSATGYFVSNGIDFYHGAAGPYDIFVLPQGMISWADGSLESPLLACWLACCFDGEYTMDEVLEQTKDFYLRFFGLALSESQLNGIFGT